jgi:cytidine deaminase
MLVTPIRLSELLTGLPIYDQELATDEAARISQLQDVGDKVREKCRDPSAVAALGVLELSRVRPRTPGSRLAFLLRSLKHPEEVSLLREVYGNNLVVISVYEPRSSRVRTLARRIEKSRGTAESAEERAGKIIDRDEHGATGRFAQDVRGAFPKADFFVRSGGELRQQVTRLVQILFGHPFHTPTPDERGMFLARAASLQSADLSRQVGAVIVNEKQCEIASGCNEVPRFGGGIYYEGDSVDHRDFTIGADPNALMKLRIVEEIVKVMKDNKLAEVDGKQLGGLLEGSRVASLVEFGRIVHAEMNAIVGAARQGGSVHGARMYCTTYPCHVCARHILAAGLREVVFIEPYPKSMALELYPDSIEVGKAPREDKLVFRPFIGVAPRRFMDFFNFRTRKDSDGYAVTWNPRVSVPTGTTNLTEHKLNEQVLARSIGDRLLELGWAHESEHDDVADSSREATGSDQAKPRSDE